MDRPGPVTIDSLLLLARHTEVVHHIAGRIRVRLLPSALKTVRESNLQESINSIPGVLKLRVNPIMGSVVIEYDQKKLPFDLWESLRNLKKNPELFSKIRERLLALCDFNVPF